MPVLIGLLIVFIFIICIFFFALAPRTSARKRCNEFLHLDFAHRGLFSKDEQIPENSMLAFSHAVAKGFPIELDVHLTKDKQAVVFHDDSLKRMCQTDAMIWDRTYDELLRLPLQGTTERIPLFSDVLQMIDGRVPLLIELKIPGKSTMVCIVANELLRTYKGSYCIESFNPFALHWYRENHDEVIRGQLASHFGSKVKKSLFLRFLAENLLFNWHGKPDFIAYDYRHARNSIPIKLLRSVFKTPVFAFTIQSPTTYKRCQKEYDSLIFDSFIPENTND